MDWLRHMYEGARYKALERDLVLPAFEEFWDRGYVDLTAAAEPIISFESFRRDPDQHPLRTPSGRIEIFSETIASFGYDDCPGHPVWLEPKEWLGSSNSQRFPLHLLSSQPATRLHSQLDSVGVSLASKVGDREPCFMNPDDATARSINEGDLIRVYNDRGACLAGAVLNPSLRRGVVRLAVGAWYDPFEAGKSGTLDKHGNANVLTADRPTSRLAQGPTALTTLVQVELFAGSPPPVSAFEPPRVATPSQLDG
jgi:biotin/methionine sulfoxide reductase